MKSACSVEETATEERKEPLVRAAVFCLTLLIVQVFTVLLTGVKGLGGSMSSLHINIRVGSIPTTILSASQLLRVHKCAQSHVCLSAVYATPDAVWVPAAFAIALPGMA